MNKQFDQFWDEIPVKIKATGMRYKLAEYVWDAALADSELRVKELSEALRSLVREVERCDNPQLMGVGRDEPVMERARAVLSEGSK